MVHKMNTNQLNCFIAVARNESVSIAANELFISQPVVSRTIASLEKELGLPLFYHEGRNIKLTHFGAELYSLLVFQREEFHSLIEKYSTREGNPPREIKIGYSINWDLIPVLSHITDQFEKLYPSTSFSFKIGTFSELLNSLNDGRIDAVIIIDSSLPPGDTLNTIPLLELSTFLLYSDNHPVAKNKLSPSLADFRGATLYHLPDTDVQDMDERLREIFQTIDIDFNLQTKNSWQTCLSNVHRGNGVVITDIWSSEIHQNHFKRIELPYHHKVSLVSKKRFMPELKHFGRAISEYYDNTSKM